MATEEEVLGERVVKLLRSSLCKHINFIANNIKIEGKDFAFVAGLIGNPVSNGITIEINPIHLAASKVEAQYNSGSKVLVLMSADYGLNLFEKQAIVHEATHAVIDNTAQSSINRLNNEIAAYIAGLTYFNLAGGTGSFKNKILAEADKLAEKVIRSGTGLYTFEPEELIGIIPAIKGFYKDAKEESPVEGSRRLEVLEPVGRWDVKCGPDQPENSRWQWTYIFRTGGKLDWHNAGDPSTGGSGTWTLSRAEMTLTTRFRSGAREEWTPPIRTVDKDGSRMSGTASMPSGTFKLWAYKAAP